MNNTTMNNTNVTCDICGEHEAVYLENNSQPMCGECARMVFTMCLDHNCQHTTDVDYQWSIGDPLPEPQYCDDCQALIDSQEEFHALSREVEALFDKYQWNWELEAIATTGSRYYNVYKYTDGDEFRAGFKVRVADHASAYCSEDVSIVSGNNGSLDDHDLDTLKRALENPVWEEC